MKASWNMLLLASINVVGSAAAGSWSPPLAVTFIVVAVIQMGVAIYAEFKGD